MKSTADQRAVAADEIAMALGRLIRMAETNGLDLLAYMLDSAKSEAMREVSKKD